jgi:hypothetical protein
MVVSKDLYTIESDLQVGFVEIKMSSFHAREEEACRPHCSSIQYGPAIVLLVFIFSIFIPKKSYSPIL